MTKVRHLNPRALYLKQTDKTKTLNILKISTLCRSILSQGLLNPLVVKATRNGHVIVDGVKRFLALRMLSRQGTLPHTLKKVPCLLSGDDTSVDLARPSSLSDRELALNIGQDLGIGFNNDQVARKHACSLQVVVQVKSLENLHSKIMSAFRRGDLTLAQASAFSALPNTSSQWSLLLALGPFVSEDRIIAEIAKGKTVVELPDGDTLILPSRMPPIAYERTLVA